MLAFLFAVVKQLSLCKPSTIMARTALDAPALEPGDCLLTGDRLEVDIVMGQRAGMDCALMLTGATTPAQLVGSQIMPDFVIERLDQLLP
jgi:ribonucleotide monophosphatase NagD (HAD superfamily)